MPAFGDVYLKPDEYYIRKLLFSPSAAMKSRPAYYTDFTVLSSSWCAETTTHGLDNDAKHYTEELAFHYKPTLEAVSAESKTLEMPQVQRTQPIPLDCQRPVSSATVTVRPCQWTPTHTQGGPKTWDHVTWLLTSLNHLSKKWLENK